MGRAEDIFQRIRNDGINAIQTLIQDQANEELFLDFKRSSTNGNGTALDPKDRSILSKAISGFGNSEGGVLLWGVDCPSDRKGTAGTPSSHPLENPKRFCRWILDAVSGCTVPPHTHVEAVPIEDNKGGGFVAVLIPKSGIAPHQTIPSKQYYIRAGSSFEPTPHAVLAGMFGRRPQPVLFNMYGVQNPEIAIVSGRRIVRFSIGFILTNPGPVQARDLYLNVCLFLPKPYSKAVFNVTDTRWTGHQEFGIQMSLISVENYRLPPGSKIQPLEMRFELSKPFNTDWDLKQSFGCEGMSHQEVTSRVSPAELDSLWEKFNIENRTGSIEWDFLNTLFPITS